MSQVQTEDWRKIYMKLGRQMLFIVLQALQKIRAQ